MSADAAGQAGDALVLETATARVRVRVPGTGPGRPRTCPLAPDRARSSHALHSRGIGAGAP